MATPGEGATGLAGLAGLAEHLKGILPRVFYRVPQPPRKVGFCDPRALFGCSCHKASENAGKQKMGGWGRIRRDHAVTFNPVLHSHEDC
jgi:hypothetical protein